MAQCLFSKWTGCKTAVLLVSAFSSYALAQTAEDVAQLQLVGTVGAGSVLKLPKDSIRKQGKSIDWSATFAAWQQGAVVAHTPTSLNGSGVNTPRVNDSVLAEDQETFLPVRVVSIDKTSSDDALKALQGQPDRIVYIPFDAMKMEGQQLLVASDSKALVFSKDLNKDAVSKPLSAKPGSNYATAANAGVELTAGHSSYSYHPAQPWTNVATYSGMGLTSDDVDELQERFSRTCSSRYNFASFSRALENTENDWGAPRGTFLSIMRGESQGDCNRRGTRGEVGLFQIMPSSSQLQACVSHKARLCVQQLRDPVVNFHEALRILLTNGSQARELAGLPSADSAYQHKSDPHRLWEIWEQNRLAYNRGGGMGNEIVRASNGVSITWAQFKVLLTLRALDHRRGGKAQRAARKSLQYMFATSPGAHPSIDP